MPDDPDDQTPSRALADPQVALEPDAVPSDHEPTVQPTAAELVASIGGSVTALAQIGLAGARARLARLVPLARGKEVLDTVSSGLETAATLSKGAGRKAGTVIKATAQDPETQELVFEGATAAAREVGLMMAGSIGGRIVDRISEKLGDKLLRGRTAEAGDGTPPAKPQAEEETG
jgi:hypothetical protein